MSNERYVSLHLYENKNTEEIKYLLKSKNYYYDAIIVVYF